MVGGHFAGLTRRPAGPSGGRTDTRAIAAVAPGAGLRQAPPGTLGAHTARRSHAHERHDPARDDVPADGRHHGRRDGGDWIESPIDDVTYNLLMALTSKLEAIDVYQVYAEDGNAGLWRELATDERRHADRLLSELTQRMAAR